MSCYISSIEMNFRLSFKLKRGKNYFNNFDLLEMYWSDRSWLQNGTDAQQSTIRRYKWIKPECIEALIPSSCLS